MALVTTEKMLKDAQAGHYAVGAFNVENLEFVMAVLAAAEETKSPVIMQTTPGTIKTAGLDYFYGMVKAAAERASVPVALHLDHGDGYDRCMQAFRTGYTSVMIDGSHESFEDNIALTKSVADAGRAMGVPVGAELGKVGGKEDDGPAVEGESPYTDPAEVLSAKFDIGHEEMVLVKDIPMYSTCEHHLLPFHGVAHVAYIPGKDGKVTGLSKIARLVDGFACRPQVQERLTSQVADALVEALGVRGVIVVIEAEHLCMSMRGVRKPGSRTITSAVRGIMRNQATRSVAMSLINS